MKCYYILKTVFLRSIKSDFTKSGLDMNLDPPTIERC